MALSEKNLYYRKDDEEIAVNLWTERFDVGAENVLALRASGGVLYAPIVDVDDALATDLRVRVNDDIYAVGNRETAASSLVRDDLNHAIGSSWTTLNDSTLTVLVPDGGMTLLCTLFIKHVNDDASYFVAGRVLIDSEIEACKFSYSGFVSCLKWRGDCDAEESANGRSRNGGWTINDTLFTIWDERTPCEIKHSTVTEEITLAAGTHTLEIQMYESGNSRASAYRERSITLESV